MRLGPGVFSPKKGIDKTLKTFLGKILLKSRHLILGKSIEKLNGSNTVSGCMYWVVCILNEKSGVLVLKRKQCLKALLTVLAHGELVDSVENVHSISTSVFVYAKLSVLTFLVPKESCVSSFSKIMAFNHLVDFVDNMVERI